MPRASARSWPTWARSLEKPGVGRWARRRVQLEVLRILDPDGSVCLPDLAPEICGPELRRMPEAVLESSLYDERLLRLQRQGRIGFYLTAWGEEATLIGPTWALRPGDWIFKWRESSKSAAHRSRRARRHLRL